MPTKIITRVEWMARHPVHIHPLKTPVKVVLFMNIGTKNGMTEKEVLEWLPTLQACNMDMDFMPDIPYNWLVDWNGNIYEGAGWTSNVRKVESKYYKFDGKSIDIGFIGNFTKDKHPPKSMEKTATRLLELGMKQNFIVNNRELKIYNWNDFPD